MRNEYTEITVLLEDGTTGAAVKGSSVGDLVKIRTHDENGAIAMVMGVVVEILEA